jgi:hypothetical protein
VLLANSDCEEKDRGKKDREKKEREKITQRRRDAETQRTLSRAEEE